MTAIMDKLSIPVVAVFLCVPLLWTSMTGGDKPVYEQGIYEFLLSFLAMTPAIAVFASSGMKRLQVLIFLVLVVLFMFEMQQGIEATNQLHHEGTDIVFLFLHLAHFIFSIMLIGIVYAVRFISRKAGAARNAYR